MINVAEARGRILAALRTTAPETVGLAQGWGRVLAAPIYARLTQPPSDLSAMDGYALRAEDGAAGARVQVIGSAPAGHPFKGTVEPGQAVRLFTGSVLPTGADCVLLQEDAEAEGDAVLVRETCQKGRHVRRRGQDFGEGDVLVPAGKTLTARDVGLAAAGNHAWLQVYRRPRIAILATGDEISLPGEPIASGGIVSSNAHALAAFVTASGGEPVVLPIARDDLAEIAAAAEGARTADLLLTTGGASVGDHDLVQQGLTARGLRLDFWKIAMRPGKPLIFGALGEVPMLGLPGNPVSAFVCAVLFLKPAIECMSGLPGDPPQLISARLGRAMKPNDQREDYVRATLAQEAGGLVAYPFATQDSGMLRTLAVADALICRPPHQTSLAAGDSVEVIRLDSL
ncbi:MAG: molybdopterin molybdenumtransferase MoeA [Rhodospirillales bacterium 20-64-7]|nr:MAG: molybdopterin molybdenumtransferase MoeA [Rhodospirillales bacterium 20-64-7]